MDLDCRNCSPAQKVERGCLTDSQIKGKWNINGERYSRCPLSLVTPLSSKLIEAYGLMQCGLGPPRGDGYLKHSKKFLDAIRIVHSEIEKRKIADVKRRSKHSPKAA